MKPLNTILGTLSIVGAFIASFGLLYAQETATPTQLLEATLNGTPTQDETTDVDVMLQAIEGTTPYSATIATNGSNFYSAQHAPGSEEEWPPLPGDVLGLDVWPLGDGVFILDDRNVDYDALQAESSTTGMHAMNAMRPAGVGGDGSDSGGDGVSPADSPNYGTNLWLLIAGVSNNLANLFLENTAPDIQYEIQSSQDLTQTGWVSEGSVWGSEITNLTPMNVAQSNRANLFFRIRSWADDGSGLPIWWQLQYFGHTGVDPNGDPKGDGWSNIQKFQNGMNPNQSYAPPVLPSTNAPPPIFSIVSGPQGTFYVIGSGLPANLSAIRIYRQSEQFDGMFGDGEIIDLPDGYFDIPAASVIDGVAQIPTSEAYSYGTYGFDAEAVLSNGTNTPSAFLGYDVDNAFVDGRAQLKDNVRFLLRAASSNIPFELSGTIQPTNYVYSGFFDPGADFNPLIPFDNNYLYHNFDFDVDNMETNLDTISDGEGDYYYEGMPKGIEFSGSSFILDGPTYQVDLTAFVTTNTVSSLPSWNASQSRWLFPISDTDYSGGFPANKNLFGLSYVSANTLYYDSTNHVFITQTVSPGGSTGVGYFYFETAQPDLQILSYYFAREGIDPTPEQGNYGFYTTNTTPLLIAGVGQSMPQLAGYAKMSVTNGYSGVYAYLGQYFDKAFKITNGIVTTNTTGVLSPYGNFFATDPGPAALVTMPDIDPPYQRGTCLVYCVSLQLDANHDGNMDLGFGGVDTTSANIPYTHWCNNNYDRLTLDADDNTNYDDDVKVQGSPGTTGQNTPDCNYRDGAGHRIIPCERDLQDFARLWVCGVTSNLLAALPAGSTITLNWGDIDSPNSGNPTIDLFQAADSDGGIGYLTNSTIAGSQIDSLTSAFVGRLSPGGSIQLNASLFFGWAGNHFIWCGVTNGSGQLNLTIADASGNVLAQASQWIRIVDIKQMYERFTVGDDPSKVPQLVASNATDNLPPFAPAFVYAPPQNTNTPYILFVHGWNMQYWEKDRFAESAFKRFYWQGYHGRFGEFRWPTGYGFTGGFWSALTDPRNFDDSEYQAWQSAAGLMNKLGNLNGEYPGHVYLLAHSMGNVVAGEALRLAAQNGFGQLVNTYVASQAALPAHDYDSTVTTPYLLAFTYTYPTEPLKTLLGNHNYGPFTPNIYGNRLTNNTAAVGRRINFYNTSDFALAPPRWCFDQITKPDGSYLYTGSISDPSPWNKFAMVLDDGATNTFDIVNNLSDRYTVMAYAAQPYSTALGATPIITFDQILNLTTIWPTDTSGHGYADHFWHSAEFRGDCWQEWNYWNTLLRSGSKGFNINSP